MAEALYAAGMRSHLGIFAVAIPLLILACGTRPTDPGVASPSTVVVGAAGISLGGQRVGDAPPDALKSVAPLFAALKERKEGWSSANPTTPFTGALTIELDPALTCQAAVSVYMTAVFAGYPKLTVKQGARSVDLAGYVPRPLSLADKTPDQPREAFVKFLADGSASLAPTRCLGAYDQVPLADLPAAAKAWCGANPGCLGAVQVVCDAGVPMAGVLAALDELHKASPKMELGLGGRCEGGPEAPMGAFLGLTPSPKSPGDDELSGGVGTPPPAPPRPGRAKVPVPTIRDTSLTVNGGLTPEEAREALKSKRSEIEACYASALVANPTLEGMVAVALEVGKKGAVMSASNGGSDLPSDVVIRCVVHAVSTVTFPAKGAVATVRQAMVLSAK